MFKSVFFQREQMDEMKEGILGTQQSTQNWNFIRKKNIPWMYSSPRMPVITMILTCVAEGIPT